MRFLCVLLLVGLVAGPGMIRDEASPLVPDGIQPARGEVRESAVGWHPYPDPVPSGDAPLATRITGTATWCAPTPRYCKGWGGKAMLAAVPSFRYGDEPYTIQVTGFHGGKSNSVLVTVVSYCDCGSTVVDLSPYAFRQLAPLSVGRIRVIVDHVRGRSVPLAPATDVQ